MTSLRATPREEDLPLLHDAATRFKNSAAQAQLLKRAGDVAKYQADTARRVRHDNAEAAQRYAKPIATTTRR
jgi:hypothetical protein